MKLYYAGVETYEWFYRALAGVQFENKNNLANFLCTYWIKDQSPNGIQSRRWQSIYHQSRERGHDWIMDSGLFTMMFGVGKGKKYTYSDVKKYTQRYINYVKTVGYKDTIVEMDVHKLFTLKKLKELRSILTDNINKKKIIFVWHIEEGIDGLIELANTYPYIALSIPELRIVGRVTRKDLKMMVFNLLQTIKDNTKKFPRVHLLGCTEMRLMDNQYYESVDSTTWLGGVRYNCTPIFLDKDKKKVLSFKSNAYKKFYNKYKREIKELFIQLANEYGIQHKIGDYSINAAISAYSFKTFERRINKWR